jgi:hypothetical protein
MPMKLFNGRPFSGPFAAHLTQFANGVGATSLPNATGFLPDRLPFFWGY